jgi:universal stress protein F
MKLLLVCLDASPRAASILEVAVDLARRMDAKVALFRAVGMPPDLSPRLYSVSPNQLPDMLLEDARKELAVLAETVAPEMLEGIFTHVGSPWDGICTAARTHDADLIVIGSHGYGALDRLLGTTAAKVVNHADRSVLIVRVKGDAK